MQNYDHQKASDAYDLFTFSSSARYIGRINHRNFEQTWRGVQLGGGTRVMTASRALTLCDACDAWGRGGKRAKRPTSGNTAGVRPTIRSCK
jgi:hypothetical protein